MSAAPDKRLVEPFFLAARPGQRFCIYHAPPTNKPCRGGIIYVHPFAEEMNKARRMAALQARALAKLGFGVLQIDLFGCGDSSAELGAARWEIWQDDLSTAWQWLSSRIDAPLHLWGLRLGGLLALDFARHLAHPWAGLILWQPVISGQAFLTQFLRLRIANEMLSDGKTQTSTQELRNSLAAGAPLEIAGYELSPALASAIDGLNLAALANVQAPIHWFEIVPESGRPLPPAAQRIADAWHTDKVDLHIHIVPGEAFWTTQEITECGALLAATSNLFAEDRR